MARQLLNASLVAQRLDQRSGHESQLQAVIAPVFCAGGEDVRSTVVVAVRNNVMSNATLPITRGRDCTLTMPSRRWRRTDEGVAA